MSCRTRKVDGRRSKFVHVGTPPKPLDGPARGFLFLSGSAWARRRARDPMRASRPIWSYGATPCARTPCPKPLDGRQAVRTSVIDARCAARPLRRRALLHLRIHDTRALALRWVRARCAPSGVVSAHTVVHSEPPQAHWPLTALQASCSQRPSSAGRTSTSCLSLHLVVGVAAPLTAGRRHARIVFRTRARVVEVEAERSAGGRVVERNRLAEITMQIVLRARDLLESCAPRTASP